MTTPPPEQELTQLLEDYRFKMFYANGIISKGFVTKGEEVEHWNETTNWLKENLVDLIATAKAEGAREKRGDPLSESNVRCAARLANADQKHMVDMAKAVQAAREEGAREFIEYSKKQPVSLPEGLSISPEGTTYGDIFGSILDDLLTHYKERNL